MYTRRLAPRSPKAAAAAARRKPAVGCSRIRPEEELVLDVVEAADAAELVGEVENDRADGCVGPAADEHHQGSEQVSLQTGGAVLSPRPVAEGPATAIADTGAPCRTRNRSVPPPPPFDPTSLSDNALITPKEFCGWVRVAISTASDWRSQHPDRGPAWVLVAGMPRYRIGDVRQWLLVDRPRENSQSASRSTSTSQVGISRSANGGKQQTRNPRAERVPRRR